MRMSAWSAPTSNVKIGMTRSVKTMRSMKLMSYNIVMIAKHEQMLEPLVNYTPLLSLYHTLRPKETKVDVKAEARASGRARERRAKAKEK